MGDVIQTYQYTGSVAFPIWVDCRFVGTSALAGTMAAKYGFDVIASVPEGADMKQFLEEYLDKVQNQTTQEMARGLTQQTIQQCQGRWLFLDRLKNLPIQVKEILKDSVD